MSRTKGAVGEREFCKALTEGGFPAHRTAPMQAGAEGYGDVASDHLPDFHFEVKRCERVEVDRWFAECQLAADPDKVPVLAYRKNGNGWKVVIDLETFLWLNRVRL